MRTMLIAILLLLALSPAVTALGQEDVNGTPKSLLIVTKFPAVEGAVPKEIVKVYDEYIKIIIDALSDELLGNGIRSRVYIHRDQSRGARQPIMELIVRDRYDGLIQVYLDPVATPSENSMYLEAGYLRVVGSRMSKGEYKKRYRVWSENSPAELSSSFFATDFVNALRAQVFSGPR